MGILAALVGTGALAQEKAQQQDDTVLTNGKILTVDADFRVVQALAIANGRIVARGTNAEVPAAEIKNIHPAMTMVGGRVVFSAAK